jgi:pantoate--beta-alanine ligase
VKILDTTAQLREQVRQWRMQGECIALVPTMGNLHAGHLKLVAEARRAADRVVVTIFVNPMQFGAGEDLESYPRTPEEDRAKLEQSGADLLFTPSVQEVYPRPPEQQTRVEVPGISDILCGASRPGHFVGVATVVCKLFSMVQPDVALFGEKDFQQLLVIRLMTLDLSLPIEIIGVATDRETDGLARSSRNGYLTAEERAQAPALYRVLQATANALSEGRGDYGVLESEASQMLCQAGFRPDYVSIRRAEDLELPAEGENELVILAAAYLGKARLIDNLRLSR